MKTASHIRGRTEIQLLLVSADTEQRKEKRKAGRAHSLRLSNAFPQRYSIGAIFCFLKVVLPQFYLWGSAVAAFAKNLISPLKSIFPFCR